MEEISYQYGNLPIPGGGYVTGLLYHPTERNLLYARTDIGGTYRFDPEKQRWISLIPHVTQEDLSETYPISIALCAQIPSKLYIACGINGRPHGTLAVSEDYGNTFRYETIPVMIHGNLNGRGTGERLICDEEKTGRLYFASQQEGLWVSEDGGNTWKKLDALKEQYLTFAAKIKGALLVGTAGVTTRKVTMRGHSLYVSYDGGKSFEALMEPQSYEIEGCRLNGLVAQRWCRDRDRLFITFASTGRRSYVLENGYSCDSGDCIDGRVAAYRIEDDGTLTFEKEITPGRVSAVSGIGQEAIMRGQILEYGFSGISASAQTPGLLAVSTIVKDDGDSIFLSEDGGESWRQILYDLQDGVMKFRAPYMRPECNGGHSLIHWLSDLKINPFDDSEAWFNTGTGVFRTRNLKETPCVFSDWCDGIEETVHLNVYSFPDGPVRVLDIVGDLGGFAFETIDRPCGNSFADADGNRYITCINADYSDLHPETVVVTARGNWKGLTKGGLILSHDYGRSFERLPMPFGLSKELDLALHQIEQPNVNAGWAAISPDCRTIVWSVADQIRLPVSRLLVSSDQGKTFRIAAVYDRNGQRKTEGSVKVFADRSDSTLFYAFGEHSDFYISKDGGVTYREYLLPDEFPKVDFGLIDCANKTEVRGDCGRYGVFYLAVGDGGLWKLIYNKKRDCADMVRLTAPGNPVYRVGLGIGAGETSFQGMKTLFVSAAIDGAYGFYRSDDEGSNWVRINTENQMFGEINSISGDSREYGVFYLATGSCGLIYGKPSGKTAAKADT